MARKSASSKSAKPLAAGTKAKTTPTKSTGITLEETLKTLESLGNEGVRDQNMKSGAGDNQFGVKRGDLRDLAAKIKSNHKLALSLWKTENIDAQFLATLLFQVNLLTAVKLKRIVVHTTFAWVADWLHSYVIKLHPDKETLRQKWMASDNPWTARAGWQLTAGRVAKSPEGLDLAGLLERIRNEMGSAPAEVQWTMNNCLAEIGIHIPKLRKQAIAIGEQLGIYRDYPCSRGCTSPFAPIWINEMVRRQG